MLRLKHSTNNLHKFLNKNSKIILPLNNNTKKLQNQKLIINTQNFKFSKALNFLSSEVSVYNSKIDETELTSVENFLEEFYEYKSTSDFKVDKDKLLHKSRNIVDLPFTLFESKGQPFYFLLWIFLFAQGILYFIAYIRQNFFLKKFNPQFTRKYLYLQFITFGVNLIFIKNHLKFIRRITIRNFNKNSLDDKNLEIKLFSGKKIQRNINELNINKIELKKSLDRNYLMISSFDKQYYLSLKRSKINDKALFNNIIRGNEIRI